MTERDSRECLGLRFDWHWLESEKALRLSWRHWARIRVRCSTSGVGMFWMWSCRGELVASFRTRKRRQFCSVGVQHLRVRLYRFGNNPDIDWQPMIWSVRYMPSHVWKDLWCNSQSVAAHSFPQTFLSGPQPFSYFFFHITLVYREPFYIWTWRASSRRKKFDHLPHQLCNLIGNHSGEGHIVRHSKVIAYLRILLVSRLLCSFPNQSRNSLCIFAIPRKEFLYTMCKRRPIFCGIFPTFCFPFSNGWLGQHICEFRIWELSWNFYRVF